MWNSLWLWCFFPAQKGLQAHLDGHLDVHPDVHLDVQFIMVIELGLFLRKIPAPLVHNLRIYAYPKDPSVLKIVRRANSLRREKTLRQ